MYELKFTGQELEIISRALGNMPYGLVSDLVVKLQAQINEQNAKMAAEAAAANPPPPAPPPPATPPTPKPH